jgi:hypothetical protein
VTWQRQECPVACDSCRAYWNTLQDLGEEWDAAGQPYEPDGWSRIIGHALAMYLEHAIAHLGATKEQPGA